MFPNNSNIVYCHSSGVQGNCHFSIIALNKLSKSPEICKNYLFKGFSQFVKCSRITEV